MIPIAKPVIDENDIQAVVDVMKTGNLAQGEKVFEFENAFSEHFGYKLSAAVSNGTVALHVALLAAGVKPGDRVLTTPFSFIASTNAILYCGAIPCFVDVDELTFNLSPNNLRDCLNKWPDAKFLLLVHLFGQPCQMDEIMSIVNDHDLVLIEDCAQAHGAKYNSKPVGSFGIAGTFSFYPTKNMTTGEGGMITTNDKNYIEQSKKLINHGSTIRYIHDITGFNYRMTNISAAIGLSQLNKIDNINDRRQKNARYLLDNLKNDLLLLPKVSPNVEHVFHQFTLRTQSRDALVDYLNEKQIGSGVYYPIPIHMQKNIIDYMQEHNESIPDCPVTEILAKQVISIPVHSELTEDELKYITKTLNQFSPC